MEAVKERYKRIRGALLKLLVLEHPRPTDRQVLYVLLDDLKYSVSDEEFASHVAYLSGKGYAKVETRKTSGVTIEMITITPEGIDLVDGFRCDVGVDVRF